MSDVIEVEKPGTAIALVVQQTPAVVLTNEASREEFYAHIQAEIDAFEPDISTAKGREAVKSFAYKITRTKTAIDDAGKKLNEESRAKINAVDAERRAAKEHLTGLAATVRKPLTDWEEAEAERGKFIDNMIAMFRSARVVEMGETALSIRERGTEVFQTELLEDVFQDRLPEAQREKDDTVGVLKAAMERATKEEADRAELEKLRAANEARELAEREKAEGERIERERANAERLAEERRADAEAAEAERVAKAAADAAERARVDAEEAAQRALDEERRSHEAALNVEREAREKIEREAQEERIRIADEEAARARREADKEHRVSVMTVAKEAIMKCGADEDVARQIVLAITRGAVPNVTMGF